MQNGKVPPTATELREFDRSLPMALLRAREAVMARFRPLIGRYGLTEQQWRVIRALVEMDEVDITSLAERCFILMPSLSRILRSLEAKGLIRRVRHDGDQRRSLISITADGRRIFRAVSPHSERIYAEISAEFGVEELNRLYDLLARLAATPSR